MLLAVLIIVAVSLAVLGASVLALRTALQVIHSAVNSNMTRALDEITQLHRDVADLIRQRDDVQKAAATRKRSKR